MPNFKKFFEEISAFVKNEHCM